MVARKFLIHHNGSHYDIDYDTEDGLEILKYQIFSLTLVPPEEQKIIGDENRLISEDSDLNSVTDEKLRIVSISGAGDEQSESSLVLVPAARNEKSDEELARILLQQAQEEALNYPIQQFHVSDNSSRRKFEQRVRPYVAQALIYEDIIRQQAARETVSVDQLEEKALVSLAKEGKFKPSKAEQDHAFLLQLLFWFKQSFSWVNSPACDSCSSSGTNYCGMGVALPSEIQYGAGSRVELYRCSNCSRVTRFPRYNDPLKLVETRRGRCGEWANCFTLYCRAFGYNTRLVVDFSDHVWTECFSHYLGRWIHLDPCEGVYDNPLLYEKGWKKNLSYVLAYSKDGVQDVTRRYTRKWHEVFLRRRNIATEPVVSAVLSDITRECRRKGQLTSQALSILEDDDKREAEELVRDLHSKVDYDASISLPGRQSGAKEWRIARLELGSDEINDSLLCPLRTCVDEHVSSIYNAFSDLMSHFVDDGLSNTGAVEILEMVKSILVDLSKSSFRMRRISIKSYSKASGIFGHQMMKPSLDGLLASLSLKSVLEADGEVNICMAGDPIKTSIALPVVFDTLDDIIANLNSSQNFSRDSLSLPLLKLNRISSGSVIASGEEFPLGIVTSAFDGNSKSKWEEPNGAKGCWVVYKVRDGQMHDLQAYEFMSANDASERDPMDWVLEGSNDGGSNWHVLDEQKSQIFEKRFQRKTFKIHTVGYQANVFRFRFLAVRNAQATSRLQIGSIDLYARAS